MTSPEPRRILGLVLRLALGATFVLSGVMKALNMRDFGATLVASYKLPMPLAATGIFLPSIEIALGVALLLGIFVRRAALVALLLLVGFSLVLIYGTMVGQVDDCSCFGGFLESSPLVALIRNLLLAVAAYWLWSSHKGRDEPTPPRWKPALLASLLLVGGVFSGFTFHLPLLDQSPTKAGAAFPVAELNESPQLGRGKQLAFVFQARCPHCWDAVANVNLLVAAGYEVFGVTASDAADIEEFSQDHRPQFPIYTMDEKAYRKNFRSWPNLIYLEDGVIKKKIEKSVPSPQRLELMIGR